MNDQWQWPSLFPPRVYELTFVILERAVNGELADVIAVNLNESADTCELVADQCIALADCILGLRTAPEWPPADRVIRAVAVDAVAGLKDSGERIAQTGAPAATPDPVFAYLSRVVTNGEPAAVVFPPGESLLLPAWATAAMLVSLAPEGAGTWRDHLRMMWDLRTADGLNYTAMAAIEYRAKRHSEKIFRNYGVST